MYLHARGNAKQFSGRGMNHYCTCGHLPKHHHMDFGPCGATDDGLFGEEPCTCPRYEKDNDD